MDSALVRDAEGREVRLLVTLCQSDLEVGTIGTTLSVGDAGSPTKTSVVAAPATTTLVHDNTHAHGGSKSVKVQTVGTSALVYFGFGNVSLGTITSQYIRFYFWADANPPAQYDICRGVGTGSAAAWRLRHAANGSLLLQNSAAVTLVNNLTAVALGQWVRIELMIDHTAGGWELRLYNSPESIVPTYTASGTGASFLSTGIEVRWGNATGGINTGPTWFDDVVAGASSWVGPTGASVADTLAVGDVATRVTVKSRGGVEALGATEAAHLAASVVCSATEGVGLVDGSSRAAVAVRGRTDAVAVGEVPVRAAAFARAVDEDTDLAPDDLSPDDLDLGTPWVLLDSAALGAGHVSATGEALAVGDAGTGRLAKTIVGGDPFAVADVASRRAALAGVGGDALGFGDGVTRQVILAAVGIDALGFADVAALRIALARAGADAFGFGDAAARRAALVAVGGDALVVDDVATLFSALLVLLRGNLSGDLVAYEYAAPLEPVLNTGSLG